MKTIFFSLLLISFTLHAQSPVQVIALDPDVNLDSLDDDKVEKIHGIDPGLAKNPNALPETEEMMKIFKAAGLESEISSMDTLDRDMLFRWTRRLPLSELTQKYPDINKKKLAKLKSLAGAE